MGHTHRPAASSDLDALLVIEERSYDHPFTAEQFASFLQRSDARCVLAVDDHGTVVAYALATVNLHVSQLLSIAVHPDHRDRRIARALLTDLMELCRIDGATFMRLEVRSANQPARRLYEALGFARSGMRPRYYGDDDALIMRVELAGMQ